jgi:hypothetical protein
MSRAILGRIIASRTGHGDFADYHERFWHAYVHIYYRCGVREAPFHFCRIAKRRSRRPLQPPCTSFRVHFLEH